MCKECIRHDVRKEFLERECADLRGQISEVQKQLQREELRNGELRAALASLDQEYEL